MAADPAGVACSERRGSGGADGRRETGKKDRGAREERNRTHEREHQVERRRQRDIRDEEPKRLRRRGFYDQSHGTPLTKHIKPCTSV